MEVLLRPANDSIQRMSTVELALRIRPAAVPPEGPPAWRLDPRYEDWTRREFPGMHFCFCPLSIYDREVRPAAARFTLEDMDARLRTEAQTSGGYVLPELGRWWPRTAMFAVGGVRLRPLIEFLFAWG